MCEGVRFIDYEQERELLKKWRVVKAEQPTLRKYLESGED